MKSGRIELDGGVLAVVDAVGGSVAVDVDDHVDVKQVALKHHLKLFHGQI